MKQNFTQLDLIRFIYKETSAVESIAISAALENDPLLEEEYHELFQGYRHLPKVKFNPKPMTLQSILRHSEQTALNTMH